MFYLQIMILLIFLSLGIKQIGKIKDRYLFLTTTLGISIFLYLFGLFDQLKLGINILIGLSILSFFYILYLLIKKKIKGKDLISLPMIFFAITELAIYLIVMKTHYTDWDEFSHWGPNLKAMLAYDTFWANPSWNGTHISYPPLVGIFEYLFCKLYGGFHEGVSYFAINTIIVSSFLLLIKEETITIKNIGKAILTFVIAYTIMLSYQFQLTSVYIDFTLGVIFFTGLYMALKIKEGKREKILLSMILFSLPLMKDTGLLLSGIILMEIFFLEFFQVMKERKITKNTKKQILWLIFLLGIIFTGYLSYKIYCQAKGIHVDFQHDANNIGTLSIKEFIKSLTFIKASTNTNQAIVQNFYTSLNTGTIIDGGIIKTAFQVLLCLLTYLIICIKKEKNKDQKNKYLAITLTIISGFILYSLFLLCIYLFALPTHEGLNLASYSRYMATFLIAPTLLTMIIIIDQKDLTHLLIFFIIILQSINLFSYFNALKKMEVKPKNEVILQGEFLKKKLKKEDKVYLIYQGTEGSEFNRIRYQIAPTKTNLLWEWSLGEKYDEKDYFTMEMTKEEWLEKLKKENFNYIYLGKVDEQFQTLFGDLFAEKNLEKLNDSLYHFNKDMSFEYIGRRGE